jgi:hypothetical protein
MQKDCRKRRLLSHADENEAQNEKKARTGAIISMCEWENLPSDVWLFNIIIPFLGPLQKDLINLVQTSHFFHKLLSSFPTNTLFPKAHPVESSLVTFVRHVQHCHSVQNHYTTLYQLTQYYNNIIISIQNEAERTNATAEERRATNNVIDHNDNKIYLQSELQQRRDAHDQNVSNEVSDSQTLEGDHEMLPEPLDDTNPPEVDKEINLDNIQQQENLINFDWGLDLALHLLLKVNISHCSRNLQSRVISICGKCGGVVYKLLKILSNDSNSSRISMQKAQWIMQLVVAKRLQQKLRSHLLR